MLKEYDEIMLCSLSQNHLFNWHCKSGFKNIHDADSYAKILNPKDQLRKHLTTILITKSYYPDFIK